MSKEEDKIIRSTRIHKTEIKVKRQVDIAKTCGYEFNDKLIREPHRLAKRRAMDCGNPNCPMCGNPRRTDKDKLTIQEKSFAQTEKWTEE